MNPYPCLIAMNLIELMNTLTLSAQTLIQIGLEVFKILSGKVKSQGACLFEQVHSVKYGMPFSAE